MAGKKNDGKSQDVFDVANWLDRANGRDPRPRARQRRERTDPGRLRAAAPSRRARRLRRLTPSSAERGQEL